MIIAVASGKGGTGKTTIATALVESINGPAQLLDCDVEEPNCHIFIRNRAGTPEPVALPVPRVEPERCIGGGECSRACRFNAIVCLGDEPLVFAELCHGCGGCVLACRQGALTETQRVIGYVMESSHGGLKFFQGRLEIGQTLTPPVIRAVKERIDPAIPAVLDCPPGTACPMVAAVRGCDYVVLVTEPTPFGLHDLRLAVETVHETGVPCGVVINRSDGSDGLITGYCESRRMPVLLRIPDDRRVAEAYSRGEGLLTVMPELREALAGLATGIAARCRQAAGVR